MILQELQEKVARKQKLEHTKQALYDQRAALRRRVEELDALRPAAPEASAPSGSYSQYMDVEITAQSGTVYVTTDQNYPSAKDDPYTGPISLPRGQTTIYAVCIGENELAAVLII